MQSFHKVSILASAVFLALGISNCAFASGAGASAYEKEYLNQSSDLKLTESEKQTLRDVEKWGSDPKRSMQSSYIDKSGSVVYTFGAQTPSVVCAVMQICDIELESGESINSVNIGDPSRWSVEPALTGSGADATQHVLIKPLDTGLETSMLIATDRRGYRIKLKSSTSKYMPHVSFSYPEKLQKIFEKQKKIETAERERNSITTEPDTGAKTYLGELNFNYRVDGDVSWKPVRVYDDGKKTIIEMPESLQSRTAPALMLLVDKGGLFSDEVTEIINYRLQDNRYVVDGIFDSAILTLDLDKRQQRVVITREGKL